MTRLIRRYKDVGADKQKQYGRNRFEQRYKSSDVELLATVDEAHVTLSGPATRKILYREFHDYGDRRYERLAHISLAHIYNLRNSRAYRKHRILYEKTRPVRVSIGERRRPDPGGRLGYLRVDTVHQGDVDGVEGVRHINAVDKVTQ